MLKITQRFYSLNLNIPPISIKKKFNMRLLLKKLGLPEKPVKPKTGFFYFKDDVYKELRSLDPTVRQAAIAKEAGLRWKKLTVEEKNKYNIQSKDAWKKYYDEVNAYNHSLTDKDRKDIADAKKNCILMMDAQQTNLLRRKSMELLDRPKRPLPPFVRFLQDEMKSIGENKIKDASTQLAGKWGDLPKHIKEQYESNYKIEAEEYYRKLLEWELRMVDTGNSDVVRKSTLRQYFSIFKEK